MVKVYRRVDYMMVSRDGSLLAAKFFFVFTQTLKNGLSMPAIDPIFQKYLAIFAITIVLILLLKIVISQVRKNSDFRDISQTFMNMGLGCINDISIPDEIDGFVTIDYCLLTPKGVVAVIMQNYSGNLYGGDSIDSWTQIYQHKSFQFDNPLRHRQKCLTALQSFIPGVEIRTQVVFADVGVFPKGKPSHVSMLSKFKNEMNTFFEGNAPDENIKTAWRKLEALKWSSEDNKRNASINLT